MVYVLERVFSGVAVHLGLILLTLGNVKVIAGFGETDGAQNLMCFEYFARYKPDLWATSLHIALSVMDGVVLIFLMVAQP